MTDAFEVTGEFAPAETISVSNETFVDTGSAVELDAEVQADAPEAPNGFVELGLAPELVAAVKDLGSRMKKMESAASMAARG